MKILLTGATGFIGARLREALLAGGHDLVCAGRHAGPTHARCRWVEADFAAATAPRWSEHLSGVDVAVNTVGIFRERGRSTFDALHVAGPRALFDACVRAGVARVVQLSALGADDGAQTAYHRSKRAADEALLALPLDAVVVQPSLVFGGDGVSSRALLALASLPLLPLPAGGAQPLQPIHVDDAVTALRRLVELPPARFERFRGRRIALVGPRPLALRDYLLGLRRGLGLGPVATIAVPRRLVELGARLGRLVPGALLDPDAWRMLERGNTASADAASVLLGGAPRDVADFIAPADAAALRLQARFAWGRPLLRASLAAVWLWTGIVSLGLYPLADSDALLARAGVPAGFRPLALYGAAALDLLFGIATLWPLQPRASRRLWLAQAALIGVYTLIISVRLPEYWLHPYGPLSKNLPILAVLALLGATEAPRRGPR